MTLLSIERVCTDTALAALEPEWTALWRRAAASPFQHPAWLLPWWRQFGAGEPRVTLLRDDDARVVALLPLYELRSEGKVLPIGVGLSDYCDALIDPTAPPDAAARLLDAALRETRLPCHLVDLPPGSALRRATPPAGWQANIHVGPPCPVLLPGAVPARQRRKLRMARHRAARIGGFDVIEGDAKLFEELVRLHEPRWGESGVLNDAAVRAFHAAALAGLSRAGLLRFRGLRLAGAVAAVIYALQSDTRVFFYLSGFDARRAFESPGTLLLGSMIDEARARGVTELHFLRGAEAYKYAWGAVDRCNTTRILRPHER